MAREERKSLYSLSINLPTIIFQKKTDKSVSAGIQNFPFLTSNFFPGAVTLKSFWLRSAIVNAEIIRSPHYNREKVTGVSRL